jgi:putative oxidoreductase
MGHTSSAAADLVLLLFRLTVAVVFLAHGWNHIFGGGRIEGTARWFESLGMRPGILHAWMASLTELGAGALIAFGLLTPLGAAAAIGVMIVALATAHLRNGFFIFRPGQGYEYVVVLAMCALAIGVVGPGNWSADHALGIAWPDWVRFAVTAGAGLGGGAAQLAAFWRPARPRSQGKPAVATDTSFQPTSAEQA